MAADFKKLYQEKNAFINPWDSVKRIPDFPEVCITTFSANILDDLIGKCEAKIIAELYTSNGELPVFEIQCKGKRIAVFLSRVGAPACVAGLEEIIALGAKKIIQFGCCGVLDQAVVGDKIMIPVSAVKDEGTSYHYFPEGEEIDAEQESIDFLENCLKEHEIPFVAGKTWTMDAIYRETAAAISERKNQGCLVVEMECAASLAVAKFRNVPIVQFLFGADNLDAQKWEPKDLTDYGRGLSNKYCLIALECAVNF